MLANIFLIKFIVLTLCTVNYFNKLRYLIAELLKDKLVLHGE